jgi:hypothetical protein
MEKIMAIVGRKRKFYDEKKLQTRVNAYFKDREGDGEETKKPVTMMSMCVFLNICRDTFSLYLNGEYDDKKNSFSGVLKMAKDRVAADVMEQAMLGKYVASVCIFNLKVNHDMVETERKEITGKDGAELIPPTFIIRDDEETLTE